MNGKMCECFRTPESYNTLLYAMVYGYNRISELSAFSGYPKNKCDKYVKTLCEFGLVRKEPEKNGHTKYYPANSYIALWYKTLLTASPNADGSFSEDVYDRFMRYFNDEILSAFYKEMCAYWLDRNINSISTDYIDTKDLSYRNVKVGSVTFDFACEKKRAVYAYYDTTPGGKLTQKLWKEIESSTTKDRPFYENEYIICTINRVPDSYWTLSTKMIACMSFLLNLFLPHLTGTITAERIHALSHRLSDSPYSFQSLLPIFSEEGFFFCLSIYDFFTTTPNKPLLNLEKFRELCYTIRCKIVFL